MVLELPCPGAHYVFVASNLHDPHKAEHEILRWAHRHGCRPRTQAQLFITYRPDQTQREWQLLERVPR